MVGLVITVAGREEGKAAVEVVDPAVCSESVPVPMAAELFAREARVVEFCPGMVLAPAEEDSPVMEAIRFCQPERKLVAGDPDVAEELVSVEAVPKTPPETVASPCPFPRALAKPAPDTDAAPVAFPTAVSPAEVIANPAAAVMPE